MKRTAFYYFLVVVTLGLGIMGLLHLGASLPSPAPAAGAAASIATATAKPSDGSVIDTALASLSRNGNDPLSRLFLQLLVIIAVSRMVGMAFVKCGQPAVVGEMVAGILLGPSLFGLIAPDPFRFVFAADSLGTLKLMSQIGVCLFMFCVGMEVDVAHVRSKARTAVMVSNASIVVPYFLGVGLAYFLYGQYAQPGATFLAFALFMGISMSITAFPVLARILQERGLTRTFLGSTAITCAAVGDVTAWGILAIVVAIVRASSLGATALNLMLVLVFIALMVWGLRPALPRWLGQARLADEPFQERAGSRHLRGHGCRALYRNHWHSRLVRSLPGRCHHAGNQRLPAQAERARGELQFGAAAAPVFCVHGPAHASGAPQ